MDPNKEKTPKEKEISMIALNDDILRLLGNESCGENKTMDLSLIKSPDKEKTPEEITIMALNYNILRLQQRMANERRGENKPRGRTTEQQERNILLTKCSQEELDEAFKWVEENPEVRLPENSCRLGARQLIPKDTNPVTRDIIIGHLVDKQVCTPEELKEMFPEKKYWWYRQIKTSEFQKINNDLLDMF